MQNASKRAPVEQVKFPTQYSFTNIQHHPSLLSYRACASMSNALWLLLINLADSQVAGYRGGQEPTQTLNTLLEVRIMYEVNQDLG
jgi:hypothetical protein